MMSTLFLSGVMFIGLILFAGKSSRTRRILADKKPAQQDMISTFEREMLRVRQRMFWWGFPE